MTHTHSRVIPRDLFNEANLLKCLGQLYLNLEPYAPHATLEHDGAPFAIEQHPADGSLSVANVRFVRAADPYQSYHLRRLLNSRESYSLWLCVEEGAELQVFKTNGGFTRDMVAFLRDGPAALSPLYQA